MAAPVALFVIVSAASFWNRVANQRHKSLSDEKVRLKINSIEKRIQMDEGKRGIHELIPTFLPIDGNLSHLEGAARALLASKNVIIMTGFPCLLKNNPPTETDGPLGAICIARTLLALNKNVRIITDECNEEVILSCVASSNIFSMNYVKKNPLALQLESFPGMSSFDSNDYKRLNTIKENVDMIIAIERAGPASDGLYKTMRGYDMTPILAPLDTLLQPTDFDDDVDLLFAGNQLNNSSSSSNNIVIDIDTDYSGKEKEKVMKEKQAAKAKTPPISIGIGDGGNEVGMGSVYEQMINSSIPLAEEIACVVPTDHIIVSSVSNWGGYALSASTALLAATSTNARNYGKNIKDIIELCLPSEEQEYEICKSAVEAGAGDGVSGERKLWVDGMPMQISLDVLKNIKDIACGSD
jgi:D-glutamate cyclase